LLVNQGTGTEASAVPLHYYNVPRGGTFILYEETT
jgi:hypothetical protein